MGVYIKGMEMPANCFLCPLSVLNGERLFCEVTKEEVIRAKRSSCCPLVPVPPHGIIDREQILDSIRLELAQANAVNDMEDYDAWMRVFDCVRKFPTIIPAEEGET